MGAGGSVSEFVDGSWKVMKAAEAAVVSVRCARKWVGRCRVEGELGLLIARRLRGRFLIALARSGEDLALVRREDSGWRMDELKDEVL
jgi:hypothetical protein